FFRSFFCALARRSFLRALGRGSGAFGSRSSALGRRSSSPLRGGGAFFAFFLLLFDHFHFARGGGGFGRFGRFFFFRARSGHGNNRNLLVANDLNSLGRFDLSQVDRLANI